MSQFRELGGVLNQLAGTTGLGVEGAANHWAGSTGLGLEGALNKKAGNPAGKFRGFEGVCNQLAGGGGLPRSTTAGSSTTVTTPSLSYGAHDAIIGAAFSNNGNFSTYTWSDGGTNVHAGVGPTSPGASFNYELPTAAGSTTFNFTMATSATSLVAAIVALAPSTPGVSPTFNATSFASALFAGTGGNPGSVPLGTYTTSLGDCIVFIGAVNATGGETIIATGAGATWQTVTPLQGTTQCVLAIGFNCSAGQTAFTLTQGSSDTIHYAVGVFSGVGGGGLTGDIWGVGALNALAGNTLG